MKQANKSEMENKCSTNKNETSRKTGKHGGARQAGPDSERMKQREERRVKRQEINERLDKLIGELTNGGVYTNEFENKMREIHFLEMRLEQLDRGSWAGDELWVCPISVRGED